MIRTKHQGLHTAIGLLILGVMLFPVYWMLNSSLQATGNTLTGEIIPLSLSLDGYRIALAE